MEQSVVARLIQAALPESRVLVDGEGCNFSVIVISDGFEGLSRVKRQQRVLHALSEPLASGELHAITVKAHTTIEWEQTQN